jgi:hypothetical protein
MTAEKRAQSDRRISPTPPFSKYIFLGRRKKARRQHEDRNYYVDRYELRYLFIIAAILVLCILDAYLTLTLMRYGGQEVNPFMLALMNKNIGLAMVFKYLITACCLIFFLLHKNFKIMGGFKIKSMIYAVLGLYIALVGVEFYWYFIIQKIISSYP